MIPENDPRQIILFIVGNMTLQLVRTTMFKHISWDDLNNLRLVRNCITHAYGDININKTTKPHLEKLENIEKGYSLIEAGGERYIDLNGKYCAYTLKEVSGFFNSIFGALRK